MTTTTSNWYYNLKKPLPFRATHEKDSDPFQFVDKWLGRSCGARLFINECNTPEVITGIVVYPGKRFEGVSNPLQKISYVETKNGPLTIVEDTEHITLMSKLK